VFTLAQIRIDSWAHQVNFDLSKSDVRRSEQICSRGTADRFSFSGLESLRVISGQF
jgi:hypothetical protein